MATSLPVPQSVEDVTPAWISQAMGAEISPEGFQIETNAQSGSGFLSSMIRLHCKGAADSKPYNLIVKLLPDDETMRSLVISEKFDKTEINFYKKTVPDLVEVLPELGGYLCHSNYGNIQQETEGQAYASVLVMEDLKPQGYYTINFAGEESTTQIQEVVEFIAKFHFAGMALEEKKKIKLSQLYDFLQGADTSETSMFYEMAKGGFVQVDKILSDHGVSEEVIEAYRELAPLSDMIIKKVQGASTDYACLIHGDLWSNNLLFNDGPQFHTKVIDWQLLGYKDPNYDLAVTIVSSLPMSQLNRENVDEQLRHYYKTFVKQSNDSGLPHLVKRDWEAFSKFFYTWGMSYTLLWFLMASEPFSLNFPRLVKIYEFLAKEVNVPEFLFSQVRE